MLQQLTTALTTSGPRPDAREAMFTVPGTYTWVCPPDVNIISVLCIGGGGSGGGYNAQWIGQAGGQSIFGPGTVRGYGGAVGANGAGGPPRGGGYGGAVGANGAGATPGGGFIGDAGFTGGAGGAVGGGSAAGYSAVGRAGGTWNGGSSAGVGGSGGSGIGATTSNPGYTGGGGGGTGPYGAGANGAAGASSQFVGGGGGGGSGGTAGISGTYSNNPRGKAGDGGWPGGGGAGGNATSYSGAGGGLGYKNFLSVVPGQSYDVVVGRGGVPAAGQSLQYMGKGGNGVVRIIWGSGRSFPSAAAVDYVVPAPTTDPNWGTTRLFIKADSSISDSSSFNTPVTLVNGPTVNTKYRVSGTGSVRLGSGPEMPNAASSYLTIPTGPGALTIGLSQDFTIEGWFYFATAPGYVFDFRAAGSGLPAMYYAGTTLRLYIGADRITSAALPTGAWTHIALVRSGGSSIKLYINGTQQGVTYTSNVAFTAGTANTMYIGGNWWDGVHLIGFMDNFRITLAARYTANFAPSTVIPLQAV